MNNILEKYYKIKINEKEIIIKQDIDGFFIIPLELNIGVALKPAIEDWWLLRKPISEKTIALNVLKWGTGGINIDGCRIGTEEIITGGKRKTGNTSQWMKYTSDSFKGQTHQGRFPSNIILDRSQTVFDCFPQSKGSAARFFKSCPFEYEDINPIYYCAKTSKKDRNEGCEELPEKEIARAGHNNQEEDEVTKRFRTISHNSHPTVKPTSLMRYLCKLITPPNGIVLDPFMGSGSTGKAAMLEGFRFIGIDLDEQYVEIAKARIEYIIKEK